MVVVVWPDPPRPPWSSPPDACASPLVASRAASANELARALALRTLTVVWPPLDACRSKRGTLEIRGVHPSSPVRTVRSHARAGYGLCGRGLPLRAVVHPRGDVCGRPSSDSDGGPSRRRPPPTGGASV